MDGSGITWHALPLLEMVAWIVLNMHTRMAVIGMKEPVRLHLRKAI